MIKDIMEVFENLYDKHGDQLIIDDYQLTPGTYVILSLDKGIKQIYEVDKNTSNTDDLYMYFASRDYYSKLLDMNKPVDMKKIIHSNQIYSFFIKKENLSNGKLTPEIVGNYYETLQNPRSKYKEKKKLAVYENTEEIYGIVNAEEIEKIQDAVMKSLSIIQTQMKVDKNYLKIFIEKEEDAFVKEGKKYVIPNIFNTTDFNIVINNETYGLPNDNMGLNAKKPFLENKQQKTTVPTLLSVENVLKQKALFDYFMNFASQGKRYIYIEQSPQKQEIKAYKNDEMLDESFMGYFLYIQKGKELEVHDFDIVQAYSPYLNFELINVLDIELNPKYDRDITFKTYKELKDVHQLVNQLYFKKFLMTNYFTEPKDIKLHDSYVKEPLLLSRKAWFEWFYKGNDQLIQSVLDKISLKIIRGTMIFDSLYKARHQFNLYHSLKQYFTKGDESMADVLKDIKNNLRMKMANEETASIESDEEYYFAVGQLTSFLLSKNKSSNKTDALINPIINCANVARLKQMLTVLYKKYNYDIQKSKRFRNLMAMILSYEPTQKKVNTQLIIAGYLHSNLIYEKSDSKSNVSMSGGDGNNDN